jgi:hypothetical protein
MSINRRQFTFGAAALGTRKVNACYNILADEKRLPWSPTLPSDREVGIAYSLWQYPPEFGRFWTHAWGTPTLGHYVSTDRSVIRQHGQWLSDAGVDFILADCSNDLGSDLRDNSGYPYQKFEEKALRAVFGEFASIPKAPKISVMIGNPTDPAAIYNGLLSKKADELYQEYVRDKVFSTLWLHYQGKPLLVIYGPTPAIYQNGLPPWNDSRFTVRFMTCFVTQQPRLLGPHGESKFGYWSWEDRGLPSFPIVDGHPEVMTVVSAWRSSKPEKIAACPRQNGATFRAEWAAARRIGPKFVLTGTFNEWKKGEQPSEAVSKDLEPSKEDGFYYLDLLKEEVALFKKGA